MINSILNSTRINSTRFKRPLRVPVWYIALIILGAGLWLGVLQSFPFGPRATASASSAVPTQTARFPNQRAAGPFGRGAHPMYCWHWGGPVPTDRQFGVGSDFRPGRSAFPFDSTWGNQRFREPGDLR